MAKDLFRAIQPPKNKNFEKSDLSNRSGNGPMKKDPFDALKKKVLDTSKKIKAAGKGKVKEFNKV